MKKSLKILSLLAIAIFVIAAFAGCEWGKGCKHEGGSATCTEPGICSKCGVAYLEATGHIEVIDEAKDATCTETGLTEGKHCEVCGEILVKQEEIPLSAEHIYSNAYDPDCNECGAEREVTYTEGLKYALLDDDTYSVVGIGDCTDIDIIIPKYYDGKLVTSIGDGAFFDCTGLTSIIIPESVSSIGVGSFANCLRLTSINVDENNEYYKSIDGNLYSKDGTTFVQYASGKTEVFFTIPESVTTIGIGSFAGCNGLISITIGSNVVSIGEYAFEGCYKLGEIYNKSSLDISSICDIEGNIYTPDEGESMLYTDENGYVFFVAEFQVSLVGYTGTETELVLPESCQGRDYQIFYYAFMSCKDIISVSIPDTVYSIAMWAFYNCDNLQSVTLGKGVEHRLSSVFIDCTNLTIIRFNGTVAEWEATQGSSFLGAEFPATEVICTDGVVSLK